MESISVLLSIMARLRDPEKGCPWDLEQSFASIVPHTLEEAYEVAEAIEAGDMSALKEELGDLLFQVVFYARLAEERGDFDFEAVVTALNDKLVRRHPHVFGRSRVHDPQQLARQWEAIKATERREKTIQNERNKGFFGDIPKAIPAMQRAQRLQRRAAQYGFDWADVAPVMAKVAEEWEELQDEWRGAARPEALAHEWGDLLFASLNLARHLGIHPEAALRAVNRRFERRFEMMASLARAQGKDLMTLSLEEKEDLWRQAKQQESSTGRTGPLSDNS